jgi:glycosyltransferase involved in cell wall biosynthesis
MNKIKTLIFIFKFYFLFISVKCLHVYYRLVGYKKGSKDILFLESMPEDGAGYTYRVKHWMNLLIQDGYTVESRLIIHYTKDFYQETSPENLQRFIIRSIITRIKQIHYSRNFKVVVIRRNLLIYNQYGNHFMEKLLVAAHPNRILDFDDDIGTNKVHSKDDTFFQYMMLTAKDHFYNSLPFYNGFIAGSTYLKELVKLKYNKVNEDSIQIIPTCVNYSDFSPKEYHKRSVLIFGWIGGNHNLHLLKSIIPALNKIHRTIKIQLVVMAGVESYDFGADFGVFVEPYSLEKEIGFLKRIDVGLMPLNDDDVSRGKCGFKLLQYMGLGVPGIASAISVNNEIIKDNWNGWLVQPNGDWEAVLSRVMEKRYELSVFGSNARKTVEENYTFNANYPKYKKFINKFMSES